MTTSFTRKAILGISGLAVIGGATATGLATAQHADAAPSTTATTSQVNVLTTEAATKAAQASLDAAKKAGQHVTVTVVDRSGAVRVVLSGDGAGPQTGTASQQKAYTAVAFNAPTTELAKRVTGDGATLKDMDGTLFLGGGVPIAVNGTPVAGIGVGGSPDANQDNTFAQAGAAALT